MFIFLGAFLLGLKLFPSPTIPEAKRQKGVFTFRLEKALVPGKIFKKAEATLLSSNEKVIIYVPKKVALSPGTIFQADLTLKPPRGSLNPFSGDYARELKARGIKFIGYARKVKVLPEKGSFKPIQSIRERLFSFSENLSPRAQGLFEALTLGEKRNLPQDFRKAYEKAGLLHLLAVSGLHIGLLFFLIRTLVKPVFRVRPELLNKLTAEQWNFVVAMPLLLAYTLISGPSPSAERAFVMFALWGVALLLFREIKGFDVLSATVLFILVISPESMGSLSFRLSVTAVAALILAHRILKNISLPEGRIKKYLIQGFVYSFFASLATSPFILWLKGSVSPWGPFTNLLAIPVFGFLVLPLEFLAAWLSFFSPQIAKIPAELAARCVFIKTFPLPQISCPFPLGAFLWVLLLFALSVFFWCKRKLLFTVSDCLQRKHEKGVAGKVSLACHPKSIFTGLGVSFGDGTLAVGRLTPIIFLSLVLVFSAYFYAINNGLRYVTILDVGQGSAAVAKVGARCALLFDAGPARGPYDSAHFSIIPFLRKMGLKPEAILISHFQADHAGGFQSILKTYPEIRVISPERIPSQQVLKDSYFELFLFPANGIFAENDASLVAKLKLREKSFLFPGDITCKREKFLLKENISAEVLILAHHGSSTSTGPSFLRRVNPHLALSSSRWEIHPSKKVLTRLEKFKVPHYGTKANGALTVLIDDEKAWLCLETKRRKAPLLLRSLWPFVKTGCTEVDL